MDFEDTVLSEKSQTQKDKSVWYHLHLEPKIKQNKFIDTKNRLIIARAGGDVGGWAKWVKGGQEV